MGLPPQLCPVPKSLVVQNRETEVAVSNATQGTSLHSLQRPVYLSPDDLIHHVNFEKALCKVYTSTIISNATQGKVVKQPKEFVSLKVSLVGFFELIFS